MDDRQNLAPIFRSGHVLMVYLEMFARRGGQVYARDVLTAGGGLDDHPASLGRMVPLGVRADLIL